MSLTVGPNYTLPFMTESRAKIAFYALQQAEKTAARCAADDEAHEARTRPLDYYPVVYAAHNYQFLAYSAAMGGRRAETIAAVDHSRQIASDGMLLEIPGTDWYVAESYTARVRFGLWKQLLALPPPNPKLAGLTAGYLYGRAIVARTVGTTKFRSRRSIMWIVGRLQMWVIESCVGRLPSM